VAYRLSVSRAKQLASDYIDAQVTDVRTRSVHEVEGGDTHPGPKSGLNSERGTGVTEVSGVQGLRQAEVGASGLGSSVSFSSSGAWAVDGPDTTRAINYATDFSGSEQPAWIVGALGPRPAFVDEQPRYDAVAKSITDYRERYEIVGDDPLGLRPFESMPRIAYEAVAGEIRDYERFLWREIGPPVRDIGHDLGLGL
jgi:hypothetical protein